MKSTQSDLISCNFGWQLVLWKESSTRVSSSLIQRERPFGHNEYCLCYWYADELPRCIALTVVFAVIFSILTTPLVLLCFVPMIRRMIKAQHDVNNADMTAVGRHWRTACQWPCMGVTAWVSAILPLVIIGLSLGIVFAIIR